IDNSIHVNFSADHSVICSVGDSVNFTADVGIACHSLPAENPVYDWYFPGATPDHSTTANPSGIVYNSSGTFDVKLIVTTPCTRDSLLKTGYINVSSTSAGTVT